MDCNGCGKEKLRPETVPFLIYEAAMARNKRVTKRLAIVLTVAVAGMIFCNIGWLYYMMYRVG